MEILKYPDLRLMAKNLPIEKFGEEERAKVDEMFRVMSTTDGIGLAAPQVGWNVRLFILGFKTKSGEPLVFWNPILSLAGERVMMPEGCLSFPGIPADVERSTEVLLQAETPRGKIEAKIGGFGAHTVQHEMDHVDGILFIDRLSAAERERIEPALRQLVGAAAPAAVVKPW